MGFLQGIYGFDILSLLMILLSSIFNIWWPTKILSLALLFTVVYRTFSKDILKRRNEYYKFCSWSNKYLNKLNLSLPDNPSNLNFTNLTILLNKLKLSIDQKKKYKIVVCPGCQKKLKLIRGRGKVIITCKSCSTEFKAKV